MRGWHNQFSGQPSPKLAATARSSGCVLTIFRDLAAAYVAFLLCISNSPYTIKTDALLWFLTGVLSAIPALAPRRLRRATTTTGYASATRSPMPAR